MITASHLPFQRNGFKFFTAEGGLEKADITAVLALAAQAAAEAGVVPGDEFLGSAYVMTMALNVPSGLVSQVKFHQEKFSISRCLIPRVKVPGCLA